MTEKIARQVVLAARPHGRPKPSDFRLEKTAAGMPPEPAGKMPTLRSAAFQAAG